MSDTSADGDGMSDDDMYDDDMCDDDTLVDDSSVDNTLVDDDNNSVRSSGSVSAVVSEGANPGPDLPDIGPNIDHRVDVVIIGSGMTAVGVALPFLPLMASRGMAPDVSVIEGGDICSGGTILQDALVRFSPSQILRFDGKMLQPEKILGLQAKNAQVLKELTSMYLGVDVREFEMEELYYDDGKFKVDKWFQRCLNALYPQYGATILEGDEVPHYENLRACGARTHMAGLIRPYDLVRSIWKHLRAEYANLRISANNPVENIALITDSSRPYIITCSRGTIQARHVVHATDSYATRLLPALKIGLTAGWVHVLSQRPGASFPRREGKHSWTLNVGNHPFDVIRLPDRDDEIGDLLIGSEWATSGERDDREVQETVNYLHDRMNRVFGPQWEDAKMTPELWSGTVGITGDYLPFVGRIPQEYTNREVLRSDQAAGEAVFSEDFGLATPGEWISAGYGGQGMAFALLSAHAVGLQIAGMEDEELEMVPGRPGGRLNDWFPKEELSLDGDRMVRANLRNARPIPESSSEDDSEVKLNRK